MIKLPVLNNKEKIIIFAADVLTTRLSVRIRRRKVEIGKAINCNLAER